MVEVQYDAVVAGAGPAGSTVAGGLAQGGFRVLLLEEHRDVGRPLHCSGLVTPRTLEEAGVAEEIVLNRVRGADIFAPSGRSLSLGDGDSRALVIDRVALDRALVARAQERGAELEMGVKVVAAERAVGGLRVTLQDRSQRQWTVGTRLLVGADGAHSRVARALGMAGAGERICGLGGEGVLPGVEEDRVRVYVGKSLAPGWFAWTIPLGGGRVRLGVGSGNGLKPIECLRRLFATHPEQFRGWKASFWTGGTIPLWSQRRIVQDNVMLVGDAAGQVKPTSGGGIYPGLVGARLAAQVGREALARDEVTEDSLSAYPRAWQQELGQEFRRGSDLRRVYVSLEDRDFDRLLGIFGHSALLRAANRYGDIDFPGRLFHRLVRLAPALWWFVRGPLRYVPLWR
ncbi:MAG: NAD(P)/FAD-dependent oxidoreductase [Chloroflexi bacterium]|nr:NAD(P)/FAD-dependent oxidoreductase [Chloroflexota bacterium]